MSSVAGHQTNHLPYGGYFAKMNSVDQFVLVDNTQYVKKQYHNRNRILTMHGEANWLTVPVNTSGRFHQKINEVEINNHTDWPRRHLKTIQISYRKTPFFNTYFPKFESLYNQQWKFLVDLNIAIIKLCRELLNIPTPILVGSELGICGKASHLICDICQKTSSNIYVHGKHAHDYVDFQTLAEAGISSRIQDFQCLKYPQQNNDTFTPNLSVIDLLFNCGPRSLASLMNGNRLSDYHHQEE